MPYRRDSGDLPLDIVAVASNHADSCERTANIHHSFLPGFTGARPHRHAYGRGVKLTGATAHFVTAELDEGPIIDQDGVRVTYVRRPDNLVTLGRDLEGQRSVVVSQ